jgi:DNA-binding CsgD family transcriptional regulator
MFDTWTDDQFITWLAGFMDGEGCIYLKIKQQHSVDLTIANTNRAVIMGIHDKLQLGCVEEITYMKAEWKTKYVWRVRNYDDVYTVLIKLLPFLVIKQEKAKEAIQRIEMAYAIRNAMTERNQQIREMKRQGAPTREIAITFGLSPSSINMICAGTYYEGKRPRNHIKRKMSSYMERTVNKHAGTTPNVRTRVTKIPLSVEQEAEEQRSH